MSANRPGWDRATPLVLLVVAVIWTWPAAVAGNEWLVGRHFDLQGTIWVIDSGPRVLGALLHDPYTAWPAGADYGRADSWTLLALSPLLRPLGPIFAHNLIQVFGLWSGAWAAEAFSRELGARAPWSWIAGLAWASGLASTALLEGHVYLLLNLWLPLLGIAWLRACDDRGRARHGIAAGLCWSLCLLTTAYLGLAATILVLVIAAGGGLRRQLRAAPMLAAALIALPVGAAYAIHFEDSSRSSERLQERYEMTPRRLLPASAEVDRVQHSNSLWAPAGALALCLVAPVVLRERRGWRRVAAAGIVAAIFSAGPSLRFTSSLVVPTPLALLESVPGFKLLRFPGRLGWTWVLSLCGVAGLCATSLAERAGRPAWGLFGVALIDVFGWSGMPRRQLTHLAGSPSAYEGEGAVLDLYPEVAAYTDPWLLTFAAWSCFDQVHHGRPIADNCVATATSLNPRASFQRSVFEHIRSGEDPGVELREANFAALALHPDLFPRGERERLMSGLSTLDPSPVESRDGGERVILYRLSP